MKTAPGETIRPPTPCAVDKRMDVTQYKEQINKEGEEENSASSAGQESKTSSSHNGCDKQLDYNIVGDKLSTYVGHKCNPRHKVIRTRSGWAVKRPLRLRIDV